MKSINNNQTQLRTLFIGVLCVIAGVMCFAQGFSHGSVSPAVSQSTGERLGDSASSVDVRDAVTPQFASITPRYVTKRIADIEIGEDVVSRDPQSGEVTTKRVANVFRRVSDHLRILKVRNPETDEIQTIETTNEHPFWVTARRDWIKAKDLNIGDHLDDVDGGQAILESTEFESHPDGIPVFNFEVEDFHNYYVRAHGSRGPPILVHNADGYDILQTQILNATPTHNVGLGFSASVGTPTGSGFPGTGLFGDAAPELVTIYHTTSRSRAGKILGLGSYGPAQGFRADDAAFFAETSDVADLFNGHAKYYPGQTPATRYTRIEITIDRKELEGLGILRPAGQYRDADPLFDLFGNRANEWIIESGRPLYELNTLIRNGRANVNWYNHPGSR